MGDVEAGAGDGALAAAAALAVVAAAAVRAGCGCVLPHAVSARVAAAVPSRTPGIFFTA
jgi:hypothetical protein